MKDKLSYFYHYYVILTIHRIRFALSKSYAERFNLDLSNCLKKWTKDHGYGSETLYDGPALMCYLDPWETARWVNKYCRETVTSARVYLICCWINKYERRLPSMIPCYHFDPYHYIDKLESTIEELKWRVADLESAAAPEIVPCSVCKKCPCEGEHEDYCPRHPSNERADIPPGLENHIDLEKFNEAGAPGAVNIDFEKRI